MSVKIVRVAVDQTAFHFDKPFDYYIPDSLSGDDVCPGARVLVPFGRGNTLRNGIVTEVFDGQADEKLKPVSNILSKDCFLNDEMLKLGSWIKEQYFCTLYDALKIMLPPAYNPAKEVRDQTVRCAELNEDFDDPLVKITPKQQRVIDLLSEVGAADVREICELLGITEGVIKTLAKNGVVRLFEREVYRIPETLVEPNNKPIELNAEQTSALEKLDSLLQDDQPHAALLYGVTGSGKTQVYLKLIQQTLLIDKSAIIMVPEISLTPQAVSIFKSRFGDKVAVFHSRLSAGERKDEFKRVRRGEAKIALGTRSSIFAPFDNIGLIVMDEEQEHTYKSESNPRFHARDIARFRAAYHNALFLMASATPSVVTFSKAQNGIYDLVRLDKRYGTAQLPDVVTADIKGDLASGNKTVIGSTLYEMLYQNLKANKQSVLLLNRRGYNTFISCRSCGHVMSCEHCSISMVYHKSSGRIHCHYCGSSLPMVDKCPECGGSVIRMTGTGTQKAEDELHSLFPDAKILRMDADTTITKHSHSEKLAAFARGEYDILIGTQMVAKGLDFPNVTLVGILDADQTIYSTDYRSYEKAFSLLTQVIGRAGRSKDPGTAVIQTLNPDNEVLELAANQDYDRFYETEIAMRKLMQYPPYCDICIAAFMATDENRCRESAYRTLENIKDYVADEYEDVKLKILGPAPAKLFRISDSYRYRMIIKCKNNKRFRQMITKLITDFKNDKKNKDVNFFVDINPESII